MSDHWGVFFRKRNDKPIAHLIDLGLQGTEPDPQRPVLMVIQVKLQEVNQEDGLILPQEGARLEPLEDQLDKEMLARCGAEQVARLTGDGSRLYVYYGQTKDALAAVCPRCFPADSGYQPKAQGKPDPKWSYYAALCPNDLETQEMKDMQLLMQLQEYGDVAQQVRPIEHFSHFKSESDRAAFIRKIQTMGYSIKELSNIDETNAALFQGERGQEMSKQLAALGVTMNQDTDVEKSEYPWAVAYVKSQTVIPPEVHATTAQLLKLTQAHHGDYDGWETPVIRKKPWWKFW